MCARHIYANWRKKYREHVLQKKFWAIAKAANREDFMYRKAKLAQDTPEGARDIMRTEAKHWARAFFPLGSMCDSVDNNLCESFNNSIIEARLYPCISMLEKVKQNIMAGLPCCHAISAIYKSGRRIEDFIDKCYSVEQFKKIYEHCLEPVEGEERWPISQNPRPQAPGYVSMPGRPRKNDRRSEEGEAPKGKKMSKHGIKITCSMCGHKGHNKTGCHKNPEKGKKKNAFLKKTGRKMKSSQVNTSSLSCFK